MGGCLEEAHGLRVPGFRGSRVQFLKRGLGFRVWVFRGLGLQGLLATL